MRTLLENIHSCNDHERKIFGAQPMPFNERLTRWHSDARPWQENNNFFFASSRVTAEDIAAAIGFQRGRGLGYLMLRTTAPLPQDLKESFGMDEEITLLMAMPEDKSSSWKENPHVEIRDIQTHDIRGDILDVSDMPPEYQDKARRNMEAVLDVANAHPEYHWLCGYLDGQKIANVYFLCHSGCIELDDLWVEEAYRNRRIATTMMKHVAGNFDGTIYLHAEAGKTPKDMYAKMGFVTLETIYDYFLEW